MKTKYDVDYFINLFISIPEENWTTFVQQDEYGRRCAYGHCNPSEKYVGNVMFKGEAYNKAENLLQLGHLIFLKEECDNSDHVIININNGVHPKYQQSTPKQRILAALYDIKAKQSPKEEKQERIVYVTIDQEVRKLQEKELILN